jgi:hypothetical protein
VSRLTNSDIDLAETTIRQTETLARSHSAPSLAGAVERSACGRHQAAGCGADAQPHRRSTPQRARLVGPRPAIVSRLFRFGISQGIEAIEYNPAYGIERAKPAGQRHRVFEAGELTRVCRVWEEEFTEAESPLLGEPLKLRVSTVQRGGEVPHMHLKRPQCRRALVRLSGRRSCHDWAQAVVIGLPRRWSRPPARCSVARFAPCSSRRRSALAATDTSRRHR